jgi:hypothetical protein
VAEEESGNEGEVQKKMGGKKREKALMEMFWTSIQQLFSF